MNQSNGTELVIVWPPLPQGDDCTDAGGRATQGAVAEGWGEGEK
jgi:hypothetical protein